MKLVSLIIKLVKSNELKSTINSVHREDHKLLVHIVAVGRVPFHRHDKAGGCVHVLKA